MTSPGARLALSFRPAWPFLPMRLLQKIRRKAECGKPSGFGKCKVVTMDSGVRSKLRGGSWNDNSTNLGASVRNGNRPGDRNDNNGFRCARDVERKACSLPHPEPERSRPLRVCVLHVRIALRMRGGQAAASNIKAPPGPVVAKAKLGRGEGVAKNISRGFAAKGKVE